MRNIKEALDDVVAEVPAAGRGIDDYVRAGRQLQRRRRAAMVAGSAAVVGMAFGGVVVASSILGGQPAAISAASGGAAQESTPPSSGPQLPQIAVPTTPFSANIAEYRVGAYRVAPATATSPNYQRAGVFKDGDIRHVVKASDIRSEADINQAGRDIPTSNAELVVYRPGVFAAPSEQGATVRELAGGVALQRTVGEGADAEVEFSWRYVDNAWASLRIGAATDEKELASWLEAFPQIAAGLVTGPESTPRVPFAVSYLPQGFALAELGQKANIGKQIASTGDFDGAALFTKPGPPETGIVGPPQGGSDTYTTWPAGTVDRPARNAGTLTLLVGKVDDGTLPLRGEKPSSTPTCASKTYCYTYTSDGVYEVGAKGSPDVPQSELIKVLEGITLTSITDESTWVGADKVVTVAKAAS